MINEMNIDDIIRDEKRKIRLDCLGTNRTLEDYALKWGKDGFNALNSFLRSLTCGRNEKGEIQMHVGFCFCGGADLEERDQGISFMGIKHFWDIKKNGYKLIKLK